MGHLRPKEPNVDDIEVHFEIGYGPAATTMKGWLRIPKHLWEAILPEDRDERVREMIAEDAAKHVVVSYNIVK